ncbi:ATP-binding protein [Asanoa sp. NPDC050611]|uniref:ATP-binding protein n=1 Tax=Asanoa sp. NPDC050611 TaxID=3157098 RepID=UPI0034070B8F
MKDEERAALAALRFNWAPVPDDVWRPLPFHVDGLHAGVIQAVTRGLEDVSVSTDGNPIGLTLQGQRGSGKTHLLGWLRQQVQAQGGYFFLISLLDAKGFWSSVLASILDGLARPVPSSEPQLRQLLRRLSALVGVPRTARRAFMGETALTKRALDVFVEGLTEVDEYVARTSHETARALALSASADVAHRDVADSYFACGEEDAPGERAAWGMRRAPQTAEEIVQELSRLLALTGPTVVAVDQIDTMLAQSALSGDLAVHQSQSGTQDWHQALVLEGVAGGLMSLRERTRRTLTVVACLPTSWALIKTKATDTVGDRFRETPHLSTIKNNDLAREIVARRFDAYFGALGFEPPYRTWPVRPEAFMDAGDYTVRQLLIAIDAHIRACLLSGDVVDLTRLDGPPSSEPQLASAVAPSSVDAETLANYDARFDALKKSAEVTMPLEAETEDATVPQLLAAGLTAWILEDVQRSEVFTLDPPPSSKPDLHARLRLTLDESTEDQVHWCFRAISDTHHGNAALNRFRRANIAAGLDSAVAKRQLFLLRNGRWSDSVKTQQALQAFAEAGGQTLGLDHEDLRILSALRTLLDEDPVELQPWLASRRPTQHVTVLRAALADIDSWLSAGRDSGSPPADEDHVPPEPTVKGVATVPSSGPHVIAVTATPAFAVGHDYETAQPVGLELEALRKHMTIFAGSGSGKTVLIRRIVEECALQGISSIVLDPNNDLARLGDSWPEAPSAWGDGDAAKAADYLRHTDVVVWTPRREAGRPLSFQPLPDFRATLDDPDEFAESVEAAVASLAPRAMLNGRAAKAHLGQAVLRRAVEYYGRRGGTRLQGLVDTLAELPDGIIDLDDADKIAAGLAQTLTATMVNDPLFGGSGTSMDPGLLLTPSANKRARISVVSLIGLPSDEARQSFVNQLQMALFAWIKKHPAADRPLLGLLVMDEAQTLAPSGAMTACTQSTLALASQARKYGLGLLFATQSPKGLHNRIPGNAATQFYGLLNSPTQVEAAREMAKAKGGDVPDISRLSTGEFYLAAEGAPPRKLRTPLCLSYHPRSPLTTEEVVARAKAETVQAAGRAEVT